MFILVELVELVEWWKKNDYINRWKDYYPIPDAFGITKIFEYQFNPSTAGLGEVYKGGRIRSGSF